MSSLSIQVCQHVLEQESVEILKEHGINTEFLSEKGQTVLRFIQDFIGDHGAYPAPSVISHETGVDVSRNSDPLQPITYLAERLRDNAKARAINEGIVRVGKSLKKNDLDQASSCLAGISLKLDQLTTTLAPEEVYDARNIQRLKRRIEIAESATFAGVTAGITSPWPLLDKRTLGFRDGQLVTIVARPKTGKTWVLSLIGDRAAKLGKRVLFVSMEMDRTSINERLACLHHKVSFTKLKMGLLGDIRKKHFFDALDSVSEEDYPVYVRTPQDDIKTPSDISRSIIAKQPDVVLLDGLYIMRSEDNFRSKWERLDDVVTKLKRIALRYEVPIITTTQFNRELKSTSATGSINEIAFADAIGMFSDLIIGLFRRDQEKEAKQMLFRILAAREIIPFSWLSDWDLDEMEFDEVATTDPTKAQYDSEDDAASIDPMKGQIDF